jgi:ABC-2 type transport system permease protein
MIATLKAEFLKILTVRSTYVILGLAVLMSAFLSGFAKGYKLQGAELFFDSILQQSLLMSVTVTAIFISLIGVLSMTHEYRYNTILYTLTSNRSRTVTLVAKILAVSVCALLATAVIALPACIWRVTRW